MCALFINSAQGHTADSSMARFNKPELRLQYAGNLGLMSVGVGKEFTKPKVSMGISYGYLPESVNGAEIHTFASKTTFYLYKTMIQGISINPYIGAAITYSIATNTYMEYPKQFSTNYHIPNAIHLNPLLGVRLGYNTKQEKSKKVFLFAELGTVDYLVFYAARNRNLHPGDIVNLSFGFAVQAQ